LDARVWKNCPNARDILDAINNNCHDHDDDGYTNIILHAILEAGCNATGEGLDALPFLDSALVDRVLAAGIEPIVFPQEETGLVSDEDGSAVSSLIQRVEASFSASCKENGKKKLLVVSPDRPCYDSLVSSSNFGKDNDDAVQIEFAV